MKWLRRTVALLCAFAVSAALFMGITLGWQSMDQEVRNEFLTDRIPRPFDPRHPALAALELDRGFLYGENRRDYAILEIPTLFENAGKGLFDTDNYDVPAGAPRVHDPDKDPLKQVTRFTFTLWDEAAERYVPLTEGVDVLLAPYDEAALAAAGDPYNYILGLYRGAETLDDEEGEARAFVGSKLLIRPCPKADGSLTALGRKLADILDNKGSLELYQDGEDVTHYRPLLRVMAEDAAGRKSDQTPVYIRPAYSVAVQVISYGPAHPMDATLYPAKTQAGLDLMDPDNYFDAPDQIVTHRVAPVEEGRGQWLQLVKVSSSELFGDYLHEVTTGDKSVWAMTLEKAANLPYLRVALELEIPDLDSEDDCRAKLYDPDTKTFTIQDVVTLVAGDADGNGATKWQDYTFIQRFAQNTALWSRAAGPDDPDWEKSVYNPASWAYRCDLNSDGVISVQDLNVLTTAYNYNKTVADYNWGGVLPHGLKRPDFTGQVVLFNLWDMAEGEVPFDPIRDAQVIPPELAEKERPETPPEIPDPDDPSGERLEQALGEEAIAGGPGVAERPVVPAETEAREDGFFSPNG